MITSIHITVDYGLMKILTRYYRHIYNVQKNWTFGQVS